MLSTRPRILVIDDEPQIHRFLRPALEAEGYEAVAAHTGAGGLAAVAMRPPEVIILDLGLPDIDGQDLLIDLRQIYAGPIIVVSARDIEAEKIRALDNNANDYIAKPFGVGELLARLRASLRNAVIRSGVAHLVRAGDVEIDLVKRRVTRFGEPVRLSRREYALLNQLVLGDGNVLTHRQLLRAVWGDEKAEEVQYLRVFINHLRQKLENNSTLPRIITTEPGVGYRFISDIEGHEPRH